MTVRRLRAKQRGPFCSYCPERATHRGAGFQLFACGEHLKALENDDARSDRADYSDAAWMLGL